MATSRFTHSTGIVKSLAAAALFAIAAGSVYAETTTSVSTQSCGWVDTSPPGLAWKNERSYQCVNVSSTSDGSGSGSSSTTPIRLPPNERFKTPEELMQEHLTKAEVRSHHWNPPEASLCVAPNRMTGDGCQPASYKPTWIPRPLDAPKGPAMALR